MDDTLEQFKELGMSASFHFADDTGSEWDLAYNDCNKAMEIYKKNPELQNEMREIAKKFLWSYDFKLRCEKLESDEINAR